jgi:hypothetical protein
MVFAHAQSVNGAVEKQFLAYSKLIIERKINDALNYTNPDMFKLVPREQMLSAMEAIFNNPQLEYRTLMPTVSGFEPVKKINGKSYVRFKSNNVIEMKLKPATAAATPEDEMIAKEAMQLGLEKKFGRTNVSFNEQTGFYTLKTLKTVVASSDNLVDWKFLVVDSPQMKTMLSGIIPAELLE